MQKIPIIPLSEYFLYAHGLPDSNKSIKKNIS
jgi:hypothetical protein